MRRLVPLLLAAAALAQEPDFGEHALRSRAEALRPDLEAALGAPLGGAVEVVVATQEALQDLLAKDLVLQRAAIVGGPRGEELEKTCAVEAKLVAGVLLAKVDLASGRIHVCPENFASIANADPALKGIHSQEVLDVVLLHEMVHVFQARRLDLAKFVGAPSSLEILTARSAVIEGHAQHVSREAARRRGLAAAFDLLEKAQTEVPASIEDAATRHMAEVVGAQLAFAYVEGEKFFGEIAGKLGYDKALERVFANPPTTLRAVSQPGEYLVPPAPDTALEQVGARVQRLLIERGHTAQIIALGLPALRVSMAPAGAKTVEAAMAALEKSLAVVGVRPPLQVAIGLLYGRDEATGATLYEAEILTSKAKDELFGKPGAQIRIVSSAQRTLAMEDAEGVEIVKTVEMAMGLRQRSDTVLARRRELVLEVGVVNAGAAPEQAARLAREILELLRGAETADPWDGQKGDDARRALVAALEDPSWGVRWRATRNLARMMNAEIDADLVRMLRDPDTAVRGAALRGLVRRGWLGTAGASERDALLQHPDWEMRLEYQRSMAEHEKDAAVRTARLLAALQDAHPAVRAYAFGKLDDLKAQDAIPWERLREGIEDADPYVRVAAIDALGWTDLPPDAKHVLVKALRDENPMVRQTAAFRLGSWVKTSPRVVEALIGALGDPSGLVRMNAVMSLKDAGKDAAPAVPALVRLLDEAGIRNGAAELLGEIGLADAEAVRKLEAALEATDLGFRFEAARALWRLGRDPKDLVPVFVETLRTGKDHDRGDAAEVLGELGELSRPYVGDLVAALKNKKAFVRRDAIGALGNLGSIAKDALPALEKLKDGEEGYAVSRTISKIRDALAQEER